MVCTFRVERVRLVGYCGDFSFAYTWRIWLGPVTDLDNVGLHLLGLVLFFTQTQKDCRLALLLWRITACYKHGNRIFLVFLFVFLEAHGSIVSAQLCLPRVLGGDIFWESD